MTTIHGSLDFVTYCKLHMIFLLFYFALKLSCAAEGIDFFPVWQICLNTFLVKSGDVFCLNVLDSTRQLSILFLQRRKRPIEFGRLMKFDGNWLKVYRYTMIASIPLLELHPPSISVFVEFSCHPCAKSKRLCEDLVPMVEMQRLSTCRCMYSVWSLFYFQCLCTSGHTPGVVFSRVLVWFLALHFRDLCSGHEGIWDETAHGQGREESYSHTFRSNRLSSGIMFASIKMLSYWSVVWNITLVSK